MLLPLFLAPVGRQRWAGEFTSLAYFSCLGMGFIMVELTFTQLFMKLIGFPLYTYSAVIFTMLAAAGAGSLAAKRIGVSPAGRWRLPFAGTIGLGLLLQLTHTSIFDHYLAVPMAGRIFVAAVMIFPTAFFMGMCMPLGILAIKDKPKGAIPWAWGMNGLFTTMGGLAAALTSIFWGFNVALLIAFGIYVLAAVSMWRLRSTIADLSTMHAVQGDFGRDSGWSSPLDVATAKAHVTKLS